MRRKSDFSDILSNFHCGPLQVHVPTPIFTPGYPHDWRVVNSTLSAPLSKYHARVFPLDPRFRQARSLILHFKYRKEDN